MMGAFDHYNDLHCDVTGISTGLAVFSCIKKFKCSSGWPRERKIDEVIVHKNPNWTNYLSFPYLDKGKPKHIIP